MTQQSTKRVLTLTGNLLAETTLVFDQWQDGSTNRARETAFQVGGKGINVSRMLRRFDADTLALCFPGGDSGKICESWLEQNQVPFHAFPTPEPTRTGTVIRAPGRPETTFLGPDSRLCAESIEACADFLAAQPGHPILAICGSLPDWENAAWNRLREELRLWVGRAPIAVDTYGPALRWLVDYPAYLVKINADEFKNLISDFGGTSTATIAESLETALDRWPVQRWVITDGPHAIWHVERGHTPERVMPKSVEKSPSAVGAGDVFLAALLEAMVNRKASLREAVAFAHPFATASASSPEITDFPFPDSANR